MDKRDLLFSVNRALIGSITPNMKAITIGMSNDNFILRAYFSSKPSEEERELLKEITSEIAADFEEINSFNEEFFVIGENFKNIECLDDWVFLMKQENN